ncbi:MAG: hypothetical protein IPN32_25170 [Deltaproteobacteria bacterium]|nr:hypothetical protein [Deltaproteobacteria bacterium]
MLQQQLAHEGGRAVPLMFELAEIHATRLADPAAATAGFLAVLELEPEHRGAVAALEQLRTADPTSALAIMRGLLPYYRRVEDRPREAEAMEIIVAAETDPEVRHGLLEQLAGIYEKMPERRVDALRIRGELFRIDPREWNTRQVLARLGNDLGRPQDVAAAYADVLAALAAEAEAAESEGRTLPRERATLRRDMLLEYAAMLRDKLQRPADAEAAYGEVLDADETHQGAYEAKETLLRARGADAELRELYRRRADVSFNPREQKDLLSRIIDLSRHRLADPARAIATAEELLDLIPDDVPTIELLAEMYEHSTERGDRIKLEETLGRWAELERDSAARARCRCAARRCGCRTSAMPSAPPICWVRCWARIPTTSAHAACSRSCSGSPRCSCRRPRCSSRSTCDGAITPAASACSRCAANMPSSRAASTKPSRSWSRSPACASTTSPTPAVRSRRCARPTRWTCAARTPAPRSNAWGCRCRAHSSWSRPGGRRSPRPAATVRSPSI